MSDYDAAVLDHVLRLVRSPHNREAADREVKRLRAENASILARLEQAERDNDALRGQLATRTESLQTANATVAATRADRDAWKAKAGLLHESLRRMIAHLEEEGRNGDGILDTSWDDYRAARGLVHGDTGECVDRGMAALREHARKAVTG